MAERQPGSRRRRWAWLAVNVAGAAMVTAWVLWRLSQVGWGAVVTDDPAVAAGVMVPAVAYPEDLAVLDDQHLLVVSARLSPHHVGRGGLYRLCRVTRSVTPIDGGVPDDFRPHGVDVARVAGDHGLRMVAVVNHRSGGSTIERYHLDADGTLHHHDSLRDPRLTAPNGVVIIGDEVYVTNSGLRRSRAGRAVEMMSGLARGSVLRYADGEGWSTVADGLRFANGIAASSDGSTVLVAQTLADEVVMYRRDPGDGSLTRTAAVRTGPGIDNLMTDDEGVVWAARLLDLVATDHVLRGRPTAAPWEMVRITDTGHEWQAVTIASSAGSRFPAATTVVRTDDGWWLGSVAGTAVFHIPVEAVALPVP